MTLADRKQCHVTVLCRWSDDGLAQLAKEMGYPLPDGTPRWKVIVRLAFGMVIMEDVNHHAICSGLEFDE